MSFTDTALVSTSCPIPRCSAEQLEQLGKQVGLGGCGLKAAIATKGIARSKKKLLVAASRNTGISLIHLGREPHGA